MAVKQLSDGGPDGVKLGQSSTDKVGFYGVTAVVQQTTSLAAAVTAGTTLAALAPAVLDLYTALFTAGLIKAS